MSSSSGSNQSFNVETLCDADDLMSWLLLHPEIVDFGDDANSNQNQLQPQQQQLAPQQHAPIQERNSIQIPPRALDHPNMQYYTNSVPMMHGQQGHPFLAGPMSAPHQQMMYYPQQLSQNMPASGLFNQSAQLPAIAALPIHGTYDQLPMNPAMQQQQPALANIKRERTISSDVGPSRSTGPAAKSLKIKSNQSASAGNLSSIIAIASGSVASSKQRSQQRTVKKKQRESVEDIEARVNQLKSENTDLQAHLMNVMQRTTEVQKQRAEMERYMVTKLSALAAQEAANARGGEAALSSAAAVAAKNAAVAELSDIVNKYTDIYADYGKCRQREVSFHLNQLEKLLLPTKTTKMSLWALQQDKSFFQKQSSPMFNILSKELGLTAEQAEKIQDRRERVNQLLAQLKESLELISTLKTSIEKKHSCYDGICGRVQEAATPIQIVHFLMWISKHADGLAKFIPAFSRNVHHTPNVEFIDGTGASSSSSGDSNNSEGPNSCSLDQFTEAEVGSSMSRGAVPPGNMLNAAASAGPFSGTATCEPMNGSSTSTSALAGAEVKPTIGSVQMSNNISASS